MPKTFIDLFAGIGGFHWALEEIGYTCSLAVEKDKDAQKIYKHNFPKTEIVGDIRSLTRKEPKDEKTELTVTKIQKLLEDKYKIKAGDISIICGGFPCQPFSKSGDQAGARDITRGTLFHDIILLTEALKPDYLMLENVRNLAGPNHKHTLDTIVKKIEALGYDIEHNPIILSPHQLKRPYGSPQVRERVFILAKRSDMGGLKISEISNKIEKSKNKKYVWEAKEILTESETAKLEKYKVSSEIKDLLDTWEEFVELTKNHNLPGFPIWTEVFVAQEPKIAKNFPKWKKDFLEKNHEFYKKLNNDENISGKLKILLQKIRKFPASRQKFEWQANSAFTNAQDRSLKKLLIQLRPSGIRVKPATHYPALVAITQTTIVGPEVDGNTSKTYRYITPYEAAKLQGMHDIDFNNQPDALSYKQLGNAVNVGVVKFLAQQLTGATPA
jgi:DNA (cytosine-5)-methyltransferase 1